MLAGGCVELVELALAGETELQHLRAHCTHEVDPDRAPRVAERIMAARASTTTFSRPASRYSVAILRPIWGSAPLRVKATKNSSWMRSKAG